MSIFADHNPLISAMASDFSKYTESDIRQMEFLSLFDLEFRYVLRESIMQSFQPSNNTR